MSGREKFYDYEHHDCDENCSDCIYRWTLKNTDAYSEKYFCNYLLDTKERRPCPAGENCTVKVVGKQNYRYKLV